MQPILRTTLSAIALFSSSVSAFAQEVGIATEPLVIFDGQALILRREAEKTYAPRLLAFVCNRVGQEFFVRVPQPETSVAILCPTRAPCESSETIQMRPHPVPRLSTPTVCLSGWLPRAIPEASVPEGLQRIEISL